MNDRTSNCNIDVHNQNQILKKENEKLKNGILKSFPFLDYTGNGYCMYLCPFCRETTISKRYCNTLSDIHHFTNCVYLMANEK